MEYFEPCAKDFRGHRPFVPFNDEYKRKYEGVELVYPITEESMRARLVNVFAGDQSNVEDLAQVNQDGPFDIIIDDGGHSMYQQIVSLRTLMPLVKPGGLYVLEDLLTAYFWFDGPWHDEARTGGITTIQYIDALRNAMHWPDTMKALDKNAYSGIEELHKLVRSIDCFSMICVFTRKNE